MKNYSHNQKDWSDTVIERIQEYTEKLLKEIQDVQNCPLKKTPLYINHPEILISEIAKKRLKNGK